MRKIDFTNLIVFLQGVNTSRELTSQIIGGPIWTDTNEPKMMAIDKQRGKGEGAEEEEEEGKEVEGVLAHGHDLRAFEVGESEVVFEQGDKLVHLFL